MGYKNISPANGKDYLYNITIIWGIITAILLILHTSVFILIQGCPTACPRGVKLWSLSSCQTTAPPMTLATTLQAPPAPQLPHSPLSPPALTLGSRAACGVRGARDEPGNTQACSGGGWQTTTKAGTPRSSMGEGVVADVWRNKMARHPGCTVQGSHNSPWCSIRACGFLRLPFPPSMGGGAVPQPFKSWTALKCFKTCCITTF